jgi:hypothetical protein
MCMMCAGVSHDEVIHHYVDLIEEKGWAMMGVTGEVPWTYTVGLRWHLHHPELIVVGIHPSEAAGAIHRVVEEIEDGAVLSPGSTLHVLGGEVGFGPVHHENLLGEWFAQWHPIARAAGFGTTSLRAVQMRIAELDDCEVCFDRQRALAQRCTVDHLARTRHPR